MTKSKLIFPVDEVAKLVAHTQAAPGHRRTYGQRIGKPGLWLVKDQGIYLMSNGVPQLPGPLGKSNYVVYARHYGPGASHEAITAAAGGDDFVEYVPLGAWAASIIDRTCAAFWINLSPDLLQVGYQDRRNPRYPVEMVAAPVA